MILPRAKSAEVSQMFYFLLRHRPTRRALRPSRYSYWRQVLSGSQIDPLPFSSRTSSAHATKEYLPKVDIYAIPIGISSAKRSLTLPAHGLFLRRLPPPKCCTSMSWKVPRRLFSQILSAEDIHTGNGGQNLREEPSRNFPGYRSATF